MLISFFAIVNSSIWIVFGVFFSFFFFFFPHLRLSFVVFTTEEISFQCWAVSQLAEKAPDISHRSAATVLRWRLTFMTTLIHMYCKELWRSVSIRQHYGQECGGTFSAASDHWCVLCHYADFVCISLLWCVSLCQCFFVWPTECSDVTKITCIGVGV